MGIFGELESGLESELAIFEKLKPESLNLEFESVKVGLFGELASALDSESESANSEKLEPVPALQKAFTNSDPDSALHKKSIYSLAPYQI